MAAMNPTYVGSYVGPKCGVRGFVPEPPRKSGVLISARREVICPDPDRPDSPEVVSELGPAELLAASEDGAVEVTAYGRVIQWRTRQPDRCQKAIMPYGVRDIVFDPLAGKVVIFTGDEVWGLDPGTGQSHRIVKLPPQGALAGLFHPWGRLHLTEQSGTYVITNGARCGVVIRGLAAEAVTLRHACRGAWGTPDGDLAFLCVKGLALIALGAADSELWRVDLPAPVVDVTACPGGTVIAGVLKDGAAFLRGPDGGITWFPRQGRVEAIALTRRGLEAHLLTDGHVIHRYFLGAAHKKVAQGVDLRGKNIQGTLTACREELDATRASLEAQKSRILALHDAARHAQTVVDKEKKETREEQEQLTRQANESPDALERAQAAAVLPLISDQLEHLDLQRVYSGANILAAEDDLLRIARYSTAARCADRRLAILQTQLQVDELRAKCRAEAVVHIDRNFAQLSGAIYQASVQRMQEMVALPASGDGRGLLPQHERTEEEKKILAIEADRETTAKAKESLDRMAAAAEASLEASRKELAEREGMFQETNERLQKAGAMVASLKARQDEMLGQVAAAEGKAAARGKDLESLRQELRVQEEAAGRLDRAVREEKEKIELERKRVQKLGATLKDLGTKGQGR